MGISRARGHEGQVSSSHDLWALKIEDGFASQSASNQHSVSRDLILEYVRKTDTELAQCRGWQKPREA